MNEKWIKLINDFQNPSLEYSPVVMWFWNGDIDEAGITYQLEKFREQNIISFFIHFCVGCSLEYLSDRHRELIQHVVREAKRFGMFYWIYDEYEYPSGTVGGQLLEKYPEYRQKEITCVKEVLNQNGAKASVFKRGDFICAQSLKIIDGKYDVVDITEFCRVQKGKEFVKVEYQNRYTVADTVLFYFSVYNETDTLANISAPGSQGQRGYLDIIRKEAVDTFIEMTFEWYKEAVGEEFGQTVKGIFIDEPTTLRHFAGPNPGPWNDTLLEEFNKEHGYSLLPYMHALFYEPLSVEEAKARDDYRSVIKKLYLKNYVKRIKDWCKKHQLLFTGHFGGEEELLGSMSQGDMQIALMHMDIPGLDSIFPTYKLDNNNYNIAGKLVSSAAKFMHVDRVLCETYTGSGWQTDFPKMKRIANRLILLGVNMLQYMGAHYSLRESRKRDMLPSSHGYINPLFCKYHIFNKYVAGLSALSAATVPDSKVLVMNPIHQAIQCFQVLDTRTNSLKFPLQILYENTVNALVQDGIGFDLCSEDLLDKMTIADGKILLCGYQYEYLVLPAMRYINRKMANVLQLCKKNDVKVIFVKDIPEYIVEEAEPINQLLEKDSQYLIESGETSVLQKAFRDICGEAALRLQTKDKIYIASRKNKYCNLYLICNDADKEGVAEIDVLPGMHIFNTTTRNEISYEIFGKRTKLYLHPYEMLVVLCDNTAKELCTTNCIRYTKKQQYSTFNDFAFEAVGGNILPLTAYEVFDEDTGSWRTAGNVTVYERNSDRFVTVENALGFPSEMFLQKNQIYHARTEVNFNYIPERVYLNAEIYSIRKLCINGKKVPLFENMKRWSEKECRTEVSEYLHYGKNTVEIEAVTDKIFCSELLPFLFFSGDFAVDMNNTVTTPKAFISCGGWEKQGYPYFCGEGIYRTRIEIYGMDSNRLFRPWKKAVMKVPSTCAFELYVNGKFVETNLWSPNEIEVTEYLHDEFNDITIKLISTLANLMPVPTESGLIRTCNGILEPITVTLYQE